MLSCSPRKWRVPQRCRGLTPPSRGRPASGPPLTSNVGRLPGSQMSQPVEYSQGCKFRSGEANIVGRSPWLRTNSIVLPVQGQPIQSDQRARRASSLSQAVQLRKAARDLVRVTKAPRCFSDASRPARCRVRASWRGHRGQLNQAPIRAAFCGRCAALSLRLRLRPTSHSSGLASPSAEFQR